MPSFARARGANPGALYPCGTPLHSRIDSTTRLSLHDHTTPTPREAALFGRVAAVARHRCQLRSRRPASARRADLDPPVLSPIPRGAAITVALFTTAPCQELA